ncbi:hypothetical protein [Flavobacterium reichenbachii]|uniref:Uncharacterized protein n=1 Tax=Flavobacterium reichenbachii TaxID=362418 RepID=A0A085ZNU8_9FLAO|nr:hypothetical protein [Flavobacterium reichenbachii]KFF06112.1 hypothetical protein IW19_11485 [Flavobacterium reichenbachii]OXB14665.1 hypothetical protein B0A68_11460 [Flavobacterium reichenbachii]
MNKSKLTSLLFTALLFACFSNVSHAQTGVNTQTPDISAALEVKSLDQKTGLLIPRVPTSQKLLIPSPATGLMVYDTTQRCVSQNAGTPAVPNWICLGRDMLTSFFYMPAVAVDASAVTTASRTLDLYDVYKSQFNAPKTASTGAPGSIPFYTNDKLYYYVTNCDTSVIKVNSISATGVLNYDIIKAADYASFMNVVFVVK